MLLCHLQVVDVMKLAKVSNGELIIKQGTPRSRHRQPQHQASIELQLTTLLPVGLSPCNPGEKGDNFYVVGSGTFSVTIEGAGEVAKRGPGDYLGELALL